MRPFTFTRKSAGQVYGSADVNELQAAIETVDAAGTSFAAYPGAAISGLSDVTLTSPATGEVLKYNASTGKWNNGVDQTSSGSSIPGETTVAAPTGVAATDTANIASAISTAGAGGVLRFRPGTYSVTGLIANQADQTWLLPPTCIIKGTSAITSGLAVLKVTGARVQIVGGQIDLTLCGATSIGILAQGGGSAGSTTLSAGVTVGAKSITVASATGIAAGGVLLIRSAWDPFNPETTTDYRAEFTTVAASYVSGTTIPLAAMLRDDYSTSGGAVNVNRMTMVDSPKIVGVRITGGGNTTSATQYGIRVQHAVNAVVRDCTITLCDACSVHFTNVIGGEIDGCSISYATNNENSALNGYGYLIMGCENITLSDNRAQWCSSSYECGGHPNGVESLSRNITWVACHALDATFNGFGAHGSAEHVTWLGCQATRCAFSYATRAKYSTYVNCDVLGVGSEIATSNSPAAVKFGTGNSGIGYRWIGGVLDCRKASDLTATQGFLMDAFSTGVVDVLIQGVKIFGHTHEGISVFPSFVGVHSRIKIIDADIDSSSASAGNPGIFFHPAAATDGITWADIDILDTTVTMATSDPPIQINGNSVSGANVAKRIRIAGCRLKGGSSGKGAVMTSGFFDGTEIVFESNDCPNVTSYANLLTVTVGNFTAMPIVRNNTIAQSATANGRGVVGISATAPTTGTYLAGDIVLLPSPVEAGTTPNKYVVTGYICVLGGTAGTWLQMRTLTGN